MSQTLHEKFQTALEALIAQVQEDRSILAAFLCGSMAYDTVWEKSDIDLLLITIDDRKVEEASYALYADGINVHAMLFPRAEFRKTVEASMHNSFMHSLLARGRLLYTQDESIAALCHGLQSIGERDSALQLINAATNVLPLLYKARKWFSVRGDLDYAALWILYAATPLAQVEVITARQLADREVIPQAMQLNPAFFKTIYTDMLNAKKTRKGVEAALTAIDVYLAERAPKIFAPLMEYLREAGETRSCTEIEDHFKRNFNLSGLTTACEYLADQGLIGKAGLPLRLTKRSNVEVQELAFFSLS
jgi:hypothetical protein